MASVRRTLRALDEAFVLADGHRRLFLVRHAHAAQVGEGEPYDPGLSQHGERQAAALAERLARLVEPAQVGLVTSPLRRARQTAAAVGNRLGVEATVVEELTEVGGLGAPVPVPVCLEPGRVPQFCWREPDGPFRPRAVAGVAAALSATSGADVVAITHGGLVNAYLAEVLNLAGEFFVYPRNTSLTVVRIDADRVILDRLNDAAHLEPT